MNTSDYTAFRDYAWSYFALHSDQRMKSFNFFLLLMAFLCAGTVAAFKDGASKPLVSALGFVIIYLSILFTKLDRRNCKLIKNAERALRHLESTHPELKADQAEPHVLCLFDCDAFHTKDLSRSIFRSGHFSYTQVISNVYFVFGSLGLFFVLLPWARIILNYVTKSP